MINIDYFSRYCAIRMAAFSPKYLAAHPDADDADYTRLIDRIIDLQRCSTCRHDPPDMEPDKDCHCGGAQTRAAEHAGLVACIQYWRKQYAELFRNELRATVDGFVLANKPTEAALAFGEKFRDRPDLVKAFNEYDPKARPGQP